MPSRTSGDGWRSSVVTKAPASTSETPSSPSTSGLPQPRVGASTTATTITSRAAVLVSAPARSKSASRDTVRTDRGTTRMPVSTSSSATGPGSRNVARQPISVRIPPNTRPSENPLAPTTV